MRTTYFVRSASEAARIGNFRPLTIVCLVCLAGFCILSAGRALGQNERNLSGEALIDQLTHLRTRVSVLDTTNLSSGFIAEPGSEMYPGGPHIPAALQELVRRGPAVLPLLLVHLSDTRSTRVLLGDTAKKGSRHLLGENWYRSTAFGEEYDPRVHVPPAARQGSTFAGIPYFPERPFHGPYVMKLGDVCYALIGQIVNRYLQPATEHEDIAFDVNSPVETPALAAKVRADWGQGDAAVLLKTSLLEDVKEDRYENDAADAMVRLRFYFPEAYRGLSGSDLAKRQAFERFEAVVKKNR